MHSLPRSLASAAPALRAWATEWSRGRQTISKELAINYAKKKKIDYEIIEPKKRKTIIKSYSDNFLK